MLVVTTLVVVLAGLLDLRPVVRLAVRLAVSLAVRLAVHLVRASAEGNVVE